MFVLLSKHFLYSSYMCNVICRLNLSPQSLSLRVTRCEYTMCSSSKKIRALVKVMVIFPNRTGEILFCYNALYTVFLLMMRHHSLSLWDIYFVVHKKIQTAIIEFMGRVFFSAVF